ncbi:hypothetical protein DRP04_10285 [Archaeoglobales archaeon]|nr:MAG: hypothetical protein DRP04_10285 [Archaeoglobales archaeon]
MLEEFNFFIASPSCFILFCLLPLRGLIVDPSYEYRTGKAIFVVEDPKTPLYLRDAVITENPSLVAGMKRYFDLIWKYESETA